MSHDEATLTSILEAALNESPDRAQKIASDWFHYRTVSTENWRQAAESTFTESIRRAESISINDTYLLEYFLNSHQEGIVLLTIHMGDYLHSILKLLKLAQRRKVVILRRKTWSRDEHTAFGKISLLGHDVEIVRHGPHAPRSITKALRKGAIAILLYDLPQRWGQTSTVTMFNKQLHWVVGPLQLAILGRACVLPFFSFSTSKGPVCELKAVRDYRQLDGDRRTLLQNEMQIIASYAEIIIRRKAAQWDHWWLIGEMLTGEKNE